MNILPISWDPVEMGLEELRSPSTHIPNGSSFWKSLGIQTSSSRASEAFLRIVWLTQWFLSDRVFHRNFPPIAKFERWVSLICNPPSFLDLLTTFKLIRWNLFWFPFPPLQRKLFKCFKILSVKYFGSNATND